MLTAACMTEENPVSLTSLFGAGDAIEHALFTEEELDRALTRLTAAGLARLDGETIVLTDGAIRLYEQAAAPTRYMDEMMENVERALLEIDLPSENSTPITVPREAIRAAIRRYQERAGA